MRRPLRRAKKLFFVITGIGLVAVGLGLYFMAHNDQLKLHQLEVTMQENTRTVYEVRKEIKAGEIITEESISSCEIYSKEPQSHFMTSTGIGTIAAVDLPIGSYLTKNLLVSKELTDGLREIFYDCVLLNQATLDQDVIDVRISYPNGEDYIVLSKKTINRKEEEATGCYLWLNEEELLRMSGAIVDAYLYEGSYLYTTKYVEPLQQKDSVVTYQPNLSVQQLMEKDINIVDQAQEELGKIIRSQLEERLSDNKTEEIQTTQDTQKATNDSFLSMDNTKEENIYGE